MSDGRVTGIGVGPGDPELLTLKGARLIAEADVIAYPQAPDRESFARAIVSDRLGHATELPIIVPMETERHPAASVYDEAADRIVDHVRQGRSVVVLCEGDPFFYGSFMYLFARLATCATVVVVPGVSSFTAAAAAIPRPLASRNETLSVVSAAGSIEVIEAALERSESVSILKLGRHLPKVRALLTRLGLTDRAYYCERVTLAEQRVERLDRLDDVAAPYFSLINVYRGAEPAIVDTSI